MDHFDYRQGVLHAEDVNPNPPQPMLDHPAPDNKTDYGNDDKAHQGHAGDGAGNASYPDSTQ